MFICIYRNRRNYSYPTDHHSRYPGTCNASVITALRATSAAPSYFDDVVCVYIYTYIYIRIYINIHIRTYMCTYTYTCFSKVRLPLNLLSACHSIYYMKCCYTWLLKKIFQGSPIYVYVHTSTYVCACMYMCMCKYVYVYLYIHVYTYE